MVERIRSLVLEHLMARLPGGDVGHGGISGGFHLDHGRLARKRRAAGGYGQRCGGLAARIAIDQRHIRYFKVSSSWFSPLGSDASCPRTAKLQKVSNLWYWRYALKDAGTKLQVRKSNLFA